MFCIVRSWPEWRPGQRALVISSHVTTADAFAALDRLRDRYRACGLSKELTELVVVTEDYSLVSRDRRGVHPSLDPPSQMPARRHRGMTRVEAPDLPVPATYDEPTILWRMSQPGGSQARAMLVPRAAPDWEFALTLAEELRRDSHRQGFVEVDDDH